MRLTVQLYTLRDSLSKDLPGTLATLSELGLKYVEMAGTYGKSASEWKEMLDGVGLQVSGSHIGFDVINDSFDDVVSDAKTLGFQYVIVPWVDASKYAGAWGELGGALAEAGKKLSAEGLTLAYHNHAFEFEGDGLTALYAAADPAFLKAQLDLAWVRIGGASPVEWIEKMAGRLPLVHVKDYDPSKTPQWQPGGQGVMDWDAILPACESAGVQFAGIELDEYAGDPMDAVRESFAYFTSKGLS